MKKYISTIKKVRPCCHNHRRVRKKTGINETPTVDFRE